MAGVDASYVVDIAARMPAGEATVSQLDELTQGLMGAGRGADVFSDALARVGRELDTAKAASTSANEALAQGKAEYALLERAALQAAKAAEKAAQKNGGVVPDDLADKARAAHHEVGQFVVRLAQLETEAQDAAAAEANLARQMANVRQLGSHVDRTLAQQNERLGKLQGALGSFGGPLGTLGQQVLGPVKGFSELSSSIGTANAAALLGATAVAGLTAAVVLLTAAAVAAVAATAAWAVGLADSARNAGLASEAMEAMHPELVGLRDTIASVAGETGMHSDELQELAGNLREAGESSDSMARSLRVAALAQTALGQGGRAEYIALVKAAADATKAAEEAAEKTGRVPEKLAQKVDEASRAVDDFAATAETKLGGIVARQMLGLEAQGARLERNVSKIFGGLNIDPVLSGVERLVGLLDETSTSGQAIKFLFESVFQPLIDQADNAALAIEAFALGFLIGVTKIYIAVKPALRAVQDFLGFEDTSLIDVLTTAKGVGELVAYAFTAVAGVFVLVTGAIAGAIGAIVAIPAATIAAVNAVGDASRRIGEQVRTGIDVAIVYIKSIDFVGLGRDMMMGLVNGITGAAHAVSEAVTRTMRDALKSAKDVLGIASPSKAFAQIGVQTGQGYVQGVEAMTGAAQSAMTAMVDPPVAAVSPLARQGASPTPGGGASAARGAPAGAGEGGGARLSVQGNTFIFNGVKDAEDAEQRFSEALTRLLEGDAAGLSGGVVG